MGELSKAEWSNPPEDSATCAEVLSVSWLISPSFGLFCLGLVGNVYQYSEDLVQPACAWYTPISRRAKTSPIWAKPVKRRFLRPQALWCLLPIFWQSRKNSSFVPYFFAGLLSIFGELRTKYRNSRNTDGGFEALAVFCISCN